MASGRNTSGKVAKLLNRTAARSFKMDTEEIGPAFDKAEADCLALASTEDEGLEIRRRVAEWKLKLHCDRNLSFDVVEKLYCASKRLGFSTFENEISIAIYYCHYCVRNSHSEAMRQMLAPLVEKLRLVLETDESEFYREQLKAAQELLGS